MSPKISIGMPVYNGEATVADAIEAVLQQSFPSFELIISDNASTDGTADICERYCQQDPRIRYVRQATNIGPERNFQFVLDEANAPYFLWAAADDKRSNRFLEQNLKFLEKNEDFVASTMPTRFEGGSFNPEKMGDRPLLSDRPAARMVAFFSGYHANAIFYSLFRTKPLQDCPWVETRFFGWDWAVVLYLARIGKLQRLKDGWVEFGVSGISNSGKMYDLYRRMWIDRLFPFRELTIAAFRISAGLGWWDRVRVQWCCLKINIRAAWDQFFGVSYRIYKCIRRGRSVSNPT